MERIALAPRQSLALVEAEGRRFLVATSPEGAPAFYALDERARPRTARGSLRAGTAQVRHRRRGSHGSCLHAGGAGIRAAVARPQRPASSFGLDAVDDSPCSDADYPAAGDSDGHDAAGAAAGGLSLFAPGAGHADGALQSHADGAGADDDLVSDDAGAEPGGPAGG